MQPSHQNPDNPHSGMLSTRLPAVDRGPLPGSRLVRRFGPTGQAPRRLTYRSRYDAWKKGRGRVAGRLAGIDVRTATCHRHTSPRGAETMTTGEGSQSLVHPPNTETHHHFVLSTLPFVSCRPTREVCACVSASGNVWPTTDRKPAGILPLSGIAASARSAQALARPRPIRRRLVSLLAVDTAQRRLPTWVVSSPP